MMAGKPAGAYELGRDCWFVHRDGEEIPLCSACWEPITGCRWNRGRCRTCHEASLGPVTADGIEETGETWSDVYVGRTDDLG
jgi:predicted amidophosphoribosyltransferase